MVRLGATVTVLDELVVNNSGQVAGSREAPGFSDRAFLWDPRTGARDLGAAGAMRNGPAPRASTSRAKSSG